MRHGMAPRCESEGGCSLIYSKSDIEYESDGGSDSDGTTSLIEGKVLFNDFHLR